MITLILAWIVIHLFVVMLPFAAIGWLFSGRRPFLIPFVLWLIAVFVFGAWAFGWFLLPFQFLIAAMGYVLGGSWRTGKTVEEVLQTKPDSPASPVFSDEQE